MLEIVSFIMALIGTVVSILFLIFFRIIWGTDAFMAILCGCAIVNLVPIRRYINQIWFIIIEALLITGLIIFFYRFMF